MKFKLLGTEIYISFLFAAVVTLMLATDRTGMILPTLFAVIMHEIGHLFAMWVLDCTPKRIKLIPASVQITSPFTKRYKNDVIIALCGPLVNLILFLTLYFNYLAFKNQLTLCYALLNLIIFSFNSLPVNGLDGGTLLKALLSKQYGPDKAAVSVKIITIVVSASVITVAVVLAIKKSLNISLFVIGIYLFIMSLLNK